MLGVARQGCYLQRGEETRVCRDHSHKCCHVNYVSSVRGTAGEGVHTEQGVVGSEHAQHKRPRGKLSEVTEDFESDGLESP